MHQEKMNELVKCEIDSRSKVLKAKQEKETTELEEDHLEELEVFNNDWKERFTQLENHENLLKTNMREKHSLEKDELRANSAMAQSPPKLTPELLNLTEMSKKMLKAKRFKEAECINSKIKELKEELHREWVKKQKEKFDSLSVSLASKQALEMRGLEIRIESAIEDQKKQKRKELEILLSKHKNIKRDLENRQSNEQQKHNKTMLRCNFH